MARIELDLAHAYKPQPKTDSDYALLPLSMTFEDGGAYALLGPRAAARPPCSTSCRACWCPRRARCCSTAAT
jgi:hypothetical protein